MILKAREYFINNDGSHCSQELPDDERSDAREAK